MTMKLTLKGRVESLFGAATDTARYNRAAAAAGLLYERVCPRCGGTGIWALGSPNAGTCYNCGGSPSAMRRWIHARLTRDLVADVEACWPHVADLVDSDLGLKGIESASHERRALAYAWRTNAGPVTREEWVAREGKRVAQRLSAQVADAVERRERVEREAARKARLDEGKVAIPARYLDGRVTVEGEIVHERRDETVYGTVVKILVRVDLGNGEWFKLWGTRPSAIYDAAKGERVTFVAKVEASRDDAGFGFFSRPTKAARLVSAPDPEGA